MNIVRCYCTIQDLIKNIYNFRAEMEEKNEEHEAKISDLMSGKVDNIFKLKEEVESEFSDRMTGKLGVKVEY